MESHKIIQVERKSTIETIAAASYPAYVCDLGHLYWFRYFLESIRQSYFL